MKLDAMNKKEMIEAAENMGLSVPGGATKAEVRRIVADELQALEAKNTAKAEEGQKKIPTEQGQPLTAEQLEKLRSASEDKIQSVLEDPSLSAHFRAAFQLELDTRKARVREAKQAASMQSPINRFKITKGGPFVIGGRITQVRTGGVVTDKTHDLAELTRQRIEFEPLKGRIEVVEGRLGVRTTVIVEDPKAPEAPSGDVPA